LQELNSKFKSKELQPKMPKKWPPHRFPERVDYHNARQEKLNREMRLLFGTDQFQRMDTPPPSPPKKSWFFGGK
jgi:hypothetical protein